MDFLEVTLSVHKLGISFFCFFFGEALDCLLMGAVIKDHLATGAKLGSKRKYPFE